MLDPQAAWPEFFAPKDDNAFPSTDADMTDFDWEEPTEQSYQADLDALMAASEHITLAEPEEQFLPGPEPADLEWT